MTNHGHNSGPESRADWIRAALERHEGPLTRYAAQITGDLDRARDVVQDTFLKLCEQPPGTVEEYLAEWLFTVCRHRALDVLRKESRMTPLADLELEHRPSPIPPPDELAAQHDTRSEVLEMVARLPARQQEVVRLKFQNGLSYAEIARITGLSATNVGFILHTAIRALRRQLRPVAKS